MAFFFFLPFELLYGCPVQGSLDLPKWKCEKKGANDATKGQGIVHYVLQVRDQLEQYHEEAQPNLLEPQKTQKQYCDYDHEFKSGQMVSCPLYTARWQGPVEVFQSMGLTTDEILHPEKGKHQQIYHVNLLKA